jgi:hypothetical protein
MQSEQQPWSAGAFVGAPGWDPAETLWLHN